MHVGMLQVSLHIPQSRSLKEKRQVVKSILERSRSRFGVAAAETDDQEVWQKTTLGFVSVSGDSSHARRLVQQVLDALRVHPAAVLLDHELEVL